jgi:tetratricopeptide (TPR) repeat protein
MPRVLAGRRARRFNRLALVSLAAGDHDKAADLALKAHALLPGPGHDLAGAADRAGVLLTLSTIAADKRDHGEAAARLEEAAGILENAPASRMRAVWLAEVFTRLGDTLRLAGKHGEATNALTAARQLTEGDNLEPLRRAAVLNAQGILSKDMGRYEEAEKHYAAALELMRGSLGTDDPEFAGLHHNLAGLLHIQGRFEEAEPEIRIALEMRGRSDPPDPSGVAADMSVLGAVLAGQGRLAEADKALRDSLALWTARYGPDHYEVAVQLNNLASVQQKMGDLEAAAAGYERALQIKERVLGRDHAEIAALLNNIAALEGDRGYGVAARAHYDQALAIFERNLGPAHPDTRTCAASLRNLVEKPA